MLVHLQVAEPVCLPRGSGKRPDVLSWRAVCDAHTVDIVEVQGGSKTTTKCTRVTKLIPNQSTTKMSVGDVVGTEICQATATTCCRSRPPTHPPG